MLSSSKLQKTRHAPNRSSSRVVRLFVASLVAIGVGQATAEPLEILMPPPEKRFIEVVRSHVDKYKAADNELQKSAVWKQRSEAAYKSMLRQKSDPQKDAYWVGVLEKMSTTGEGNAAIVVRITPDITLSTNNNELSDALSKRRSLIKHGSSEFKALSTLKTGAVIRFIGAIETPGAGLTESGKMLTPDFTTVFKSIEAVPGATVRK